MLLEYGTPQALHYVGWSYPIWSVSLSVFHHNMVNIHESSTVHARLRVSWYRLEAFKVNEILHSMW